VDEKGHKTGASSLETREMAEYLDTLFGEFLTKLEAKKILDKIDLVVVADHGMLNYTNVIYLEDFLDTTDSRLLFSPAGTMIKIYSANGDENDPVIGETLAKLKTSKDMVCSRRRDVLERYHFSQSRVRELFSLDLLNCRESEHLFVLQNLAIISLWQEVALGNWMLQAMDGITWLIPWQLSLLLKVPRSRRAKKLKSWKT
jgi:hypothetical protein